MKNLIINVLCIISLNTFAQDSTTEFDGNKWDAPYTLAVPEGWDVERFLIPIAFAPQIPYKGVEDLRFTPGWGDAKSNQYWSYAFLWYLDGKPKTNSKIIENNLNAYYTGLVGRNIEKRKIPAEKIISIKTEIKKVKTYTDDLKTYTGTIHMLDYMEQKPITLNCIVHLKSCSEKNKTFLFYEISPKPFADNVWQSLNQLWKDFTCHKIGDIK